MPAKNLSPGSSIPKGLRNKAQGCEERATLGESIDELPTPTGLRPTDGDRPAKDSDSTPLGLRIFKQRCPSVARSSQPWAGGHNPVGIEDPSKERLPQVLGC